MTRYIIAAVAFVILIALAVPGFAGVPSDEDLKTSAGVEKLFSDIQQESN